MAKLRNPLTVYQGRRLFPASIVFGAGSVLSTTKTRYLFAGYSDTPAEITPVRVGSPRTGNISRLQIFHNVLGGSTSAIMYRVRVGNAGTTVSVLLPANSLYGVDSGNLWPVTIGQPIDIEVTKLVDVLSPPENIVAIVEVS